MLHAYLLTFKATSGSRKYIYWQRFYPDMETAQQNGREVILAEYPNACRIHIELFAF